MMLVITVDSPHHNRDGVVHDRIGTPSSNPGIRGTSTDLMSFTGVSKGNTSKTRSVYIVNAGTSLKSIRDHLASIGLFTDIIDVQLFTIKSKLDSS